jgi:hypothetical protein
VIRFSRITPRNNLAEWNLYASLVIKPSKEDQGRKKRLPDDEKCLPLIPFNGNGDWRFTSVKASFESEMFFIDGYFKNAKGYRCAVS